MRFSFRRRVAVPQATATGEPARLAGSREHHSASGSDDAGHALRAASTLRAFNRYEIKYLVPSVDAPALRAELTSRLDLDDNCGDGAYGVWRVYYDTPQLRFYWEKIEGLRFRRKLRIRHYGDRSRVDDDTTVY